MHRQSCGIFKKRKKNPLLPSGGQNGQSVQHSCAHWLLLQHWGLSVLPQDHQSADEEKPAGKSLMNRKMSKSVKRTDHPKTKNIYFSSYMKCC